MSRQSAGFVRGEKQQTVMLKMRARQLVSFCISGDFERGGMGVCGLMG